jgi:methionyl-tRNA formyltransferase
MNYQSSERLGVLGVFGEPATGYAIQALINEGLKIHCVYLDQIRASQRDLDIWDERTGGNLPCVLMDTILQNRLTIKVVDRHDSSLAAKVFKNDHISLMVNAVTHRKISTHCLNAVSRGLVSVHPGIMPEYRGSCNVEWAILNNDRVGNTVFFMDGELDAGPILKSQFVSCLGFKTYEQVRTAVYMEGFKLLSREANRVIEEDIRCASREGLKNSAKAGIFKPMPSDMLEKVKESIRMKEYKFLTEN